MKKILLVTFISISSSFYAQEKGEATHSSPERTSAEFPGGTSELKKFVSSNLKLPEIVMQQNISESCKIRFMIDEFGSIHDITLIQSISSCPACDQEALRVVKAMPNWKSATKGGKPIKSVLTIPIEFDASKQ